MSDGLRPQEPFLVGVEDRHERDLREVEPFPQEVDADEGVEDAPPQVSDDLDPLQRLDVGVEVAGPHAELEEVARQVLGHPLGQRRDERPLPPRRPLADTSEEIVDLPLHGLHLDAGVDEARRADDLLHDLASRLLKLVRGRRRRHVESLSDALEPLLELQRPVVEGRGEAEAVLDERLLAGPVAVVHGSHLRERLVALVDDRQVVGREVVEEGRRRLSGSAAREMAGVVLDA